jgi:hypothetical protein
MLSGARPARSTGMGPLLLGDPHLGIAAIEHSWATVDEPELVVSLATIQQ